MPVLEEERPCLSKYRKIYFPDREISLALFLDYLQKKNNVGSIPVFRRKCVVLLVSTRFHISNCPSSLKILIHKV